MSAYRALICVTTCLRLERLRRYLPPLAAWVDEDPRFDLVVALDGDEADYRAFCRRWTIPLVWSEEREGVGLSKNRVLSRYGSYDAYFFLDDDAELVDGTVFPVHVEVARASGIPHFSLFERGGLRKPSGTSRAAGWTIRHGAFGGGQFNFFTAEGLRAVGGWDPLFARWRRWGHTEHSHRFVHAGLAPAAFNVIEGLSDCLIWHYPPSVSRADALPRGEDQLVPQERALIESGRSYLPVQTLSPFHDNGVDPGGAHPLADAVRERGRYPLLEGRERRRCRAEYLLWRARTAEGPIRRGWSWLRGVAAWPSNPRLRHEVRKRLGGGG